MDFVNKIKSFVSNLIDKNKKEIDTLPATSFELSIIDTSDIKINRSLTDFEKSHLAKLESEFNFETSSLFSYDKDLTRELNIYRDIYTKKINKNIEENQKLLDEKAFFSENDFDNSNSFPSNRLILKRKLDIGFNYSEILNLISNIKEIRRECELRIILLENVGNILIDKKNVSSKNFRKSKLQLSYSKEKDQIQSINNAIERLKITIKLADTLTLLMQKELKENMALEEPLEKFIENGNAEENLKIIDELLSEKFKILKQKLETIQNLQKKEILLNGISLKNLNFDNLTTKEKNKFIVTAQEKIDTYTIKNHDKFLKPETGILATFLSTLSTLKPEIESDYLDLNLYAKKYSNRSKKRFETYRNKIVEIQRVSYLFEDYIPENFEEDLYRTKFYLNSMMYETNSNDINPEINIYEFENESEEKYFAKFVEDIINNIMLHSKDRTLIKFVQKNLNINNSSDIIKNYIKLISLLRIEKYGLTGLATLRIYNIIDTHPSSIEELDENDLQKIFQEITIDPYRQEISLFYQNKIGQLRSHWIDLMYNMSDKAIWYRCLFTSYADDSYDFYIDTQKMVNKTIRDKASNWNENHIRLKVPLSWNEKNKSNKNETIDIDVSNVISRLSILLENINKYNNSKISKEEIRDKILNLHSFKIDKNCTDSTYAFIDKNGQLQVDVSIKYDPNENINDFISRASLILLDSLLYSSKQNLDKNDTFKIGHTVYSLGRKDKNGRGYIFHGFDIYSTSPQGQQNIDLYTRSFEEYIFSKNFTNYISNHISNSFGNEYSYPNEYPRKRNKYTIAVLFLNELLKDDKNEHCIINIRDMNDLWQSILHTDINESIMYYSNGHSKNRKFKRKIF